MRRCVEIMAQEGLTVRVAAEKAGITPDTAVRNLRKPHVAAVLNKHIRDIRENAGQRAFLRNVHLAETAKSEAVRADLNKWIAGVDNIAPIRRVEGRMTYTHRFAGFEFDDDEAIDVTPETDV